MADVIPFAPKEAQPTEMTLDLTMNGVTVLSQYGSKLELNRNLADLQFVIAELQDTLQTVEAVFRQLHPNAPQSGCLVRITDPVLTCTGQQPANDNIL
jgi:hypothetical protein